MFPPTNPLRSPEYTAVLGGLLIVFYWVANLFDYCCYSNYSYCCTLVRVSKRSTDSVDYNRPVVCLFGRHTVDNGRRSFRCHDGQFEIRHRYDGPSNPANPDAVVCRPVNDSRRTCDAMSHMDGINRTEAWANDGADDSMMLALAVHEAVPRTVDQIGFSIEPNNNGITMNWPTSQMPRGNYFMYRLNKKINV